MSEKEVKIIKGELRSSLDPEIHEITVRDLIRVKDGEFTRIGFEFENITFNNKYDESEKESGEDEIIYFRGHHFKIVKEEKEFPNGIFVPYFINLRLERLPE